MIDRWSQINRWVFANKSTFFPEFFEEQTYQGMVFSSGSISVIKRAHLHGNLAGFNAYDQLQASVVIFAMKC